MKRSAVVVVLLMAGISALGERAASATAQTCIAGGGADAGDHAIGVTIWHSCDRSDSGGVFEPGLPAA